VLQELLSGTILTGGIGAVQVLIGGEGSWTNLRQCSIVLARYGSPGLATGTLGVLDDAHALRAHDLDVRFIAGLMSEMVTKPCSNNKEITFLYSKNLRFFEYKKWKFSNYLFRRGCDL